MEMFMLTKSIWLEDGRSEKDDKQVASVESVSSLKKVVTNTEQALKAAQESRQKNTPSDAARAATKPTDAHVREGKTIKTDVLRDWLERKRAELNEKQHEFLTLVVKR
eukprot:479053-Amphidinium_carterae.1